MIRRYGRSSALISFIYPAFFYSALAVLIGVLFWPYFYFVKSGVLITIAIIGIWRYTLIAINYTRSLIYGRIVYPRIKQQIEALPENERFPDHIYFVIPSYKEEPWVSAEVFQSIFADLNNIPCSATLVVSTGSDDDDRIVTTLFNAHPFKDNVELILQRQSQGKRVAMGHALRLIARHWNNRHHSDKNSVTVFMDGDSYLPLYTLEKCIPPFAAYENLGAVTTNEIAYINTRSKWYLDWFNLKFGQRHVLFQSQSLSRRVLTLTGRFSVFRTSIVVEESFIRQIEHDVITHPFYGKFRFLMGDDKSSWYYIMKNNYDMLYIPDATIYSLESREGEFLKLSRSLPFRWYGNTLRNNSRARKIKSIPPFIRYLLYDQLFLIWTSLVGIVGAIYLAIFVDFVYLPIYLAWVLLVRVVQMFVIAFSGHPVSMRTIPLMLYGQWAGSMIKIYTYFHLANQSWSKSGSEVQNASADHAPLRHPLARSFSKIRMASAIMLFLFAMLLSNDRFLRLPDTSIVDLQLHAETIQPQQTVRAALQGVVPDDGRDDASALNALIEQVAPGTVIELPKGTLDLFEPLVIRRSHVSVTGAGTILVSHLSTKDGAAVLVEGRTGNTTGKLLENAYGKTAFTVAWKHVPPPGALLLLEQPNDADYVRNVLGATVWYKQYPTIRTEIVKAASVSDKGLRLTHAVYTPLMKGTIIKTLHPVEDVHLRGFTLKGDQPSAPYRHKYGNDVPEKMYDGIVFRYAAGCTIEDISILDSGSNPLVFERTYGIAGRHIHIDGALNKGINGNGYLRLNKAFRTRLENITVRDLRHITIQWASAYNHLSHIDAIDTDLNFHGGGSHHNRVDSIRFQVDPAAHPWGEVFITPTDAKWAPPDGEENIVIRP